jgi:hypothetical protein
MGSTPAWREAGRIARIFVLCLQKHVLVYGVLNMHVSNSQSKPAAKPPARVAEPPPSGTPELPVEGYLAQSGPSAQYFVEPTRLAFASDPVDEEEARLILEVRYQEYVARRALEGLFASGEAEFLCV